MSVNVVIREISHLSKSLAFDKAEVIQKGFVLCRKTGSGGPDPQCSILCTHRHASPMVIFFTALSRHSPVIKSKVIRKHSSRQKT